MPAPPRSRPAVSEWRPTPDPDGRFSSGTPDFDRLLGGGFPRGSLALFSLDASVGRDDLDLLLFPTYLNMLYHSRGIVAILPSHDSPHEFRARLTRYATRRRFDTRVRVMDYVGEDEGPPYVVNIRGAHLDPAPSKPSPKERARAMAKAVAAERAAQGTRGKPYLELTAFEIFETLMGAERAGQLYFFGVKRARQLGNLVVGILGPGLGCAPGVRRMADTEFELRRDDVGLVIRGLRPAFASHVVAPDAHLGAPHVSFVPRPA